MRLATILFVVMVTIFAPVTVSVTGTVASIAIAEDGGD